MNVKNHTTHPRVPDIMCGIKIDVLSLTQEFQWISHLFESRAPGEDSPDFHGSPAFCGSQLWSTATVTDHRWPRARAQVCPDTTKVTAWPEPGSS